MVTRLGFGIVLKKLIVLILDLSWICPRFVPICPEILGDDHFWGHECLVAFVPVPGTF